MGLPDGDPIQEHGTLPPEGEGLQAVRFASVNEEIEPLQTIPTVPHPAEQSQLNDGTASNSDDAMKNLCEKLHTSHIRQTRMSNFAFEPCSLPASRHPSNDSTPNPSTREGTRSDDPSPKASPPASAATTPLLTPDGSRSKEAQVSDNSKTGNNEVNQELEASSESDAQAKAVRVDPGEASSASVSTFQQSAEEQESTRPSSISQQSSVEEGRSKGSIAFALGPSDSASSQSPSQSREISPASSARETARNSVAQNNQRPSTPVGNKDDPYARSRRPPQNKNPGKVEPRFKFGSTDGRRSSQKIPGSVDHSSSSSTQPSGGKDAKSEHRKSTLSLLGGKEHGHEEKSDRHGSMSDLKRFFGLGHHHHHHKSKRPASPAPAARASVDKSGTRTPPRHASAISMPFAEDHGLEQKYGKFSKLLGSGAGGSVRLMTRASDNTTFAVKQFREKHHYESVRDYNKKVTAEFCIGSTLHHENIIETLDIIQEGGRWFEVMEYAPYDLFAIVMTGKMSREEINCCFLQIVDGVAFLHGSGLAHRDLKLDNVVVNELGIMKIIDFGSASVFKYPFESDLIEATGVVGSDPYLAPEVYDERKYDPQPADIWSLAIIYACMMLRRFPWKAPRLTDNSFKLFISDPSPGQNVAEGERNASNADQSKPGAEEPSVHGQSQHHHHHHHHHHESERKEDEGPAQEGEPVRNNSSAPAAPKAEAMKGPWRLLRLLPRETRIIVDKMLKVDPHKRATLADIQADPWVQNAPICHQLDRGQVRRAGKHTHILEPPSSTSDNNSKQ